MLTIIKTQKGRNLYRVEGASIAFPNFQGLERKPYNAKGRRNFVLVLDQEDAEGLMDAGFYVRVKPPLSEDGSVRYSIPVNVNYSSVVPPVVKTVKNGRGIVHTEQSVGALDDCEFDYLDVIFNGYDSMRSDGTPTTTAYLTELVATIAGDRFGGRYDDIEFD